MSQITDHGRPVTPVSHYHGDHIYDYANLFYFGTQYFRSVSHDNEYLVDCKASSADDSWEKITDFVACRQTTFGPITSPPSFYPASIREELLPVSTARQLGSSANSRVNNASVVSRIDVYGNSILLCGDLERNAWEAILSDNTIYGPQWRPLVSNIDILVAPHHGHTSGFSTTLLDFAKPSVVLASVQSRNPNVESRYSKSPVRGLQIGNADYKLITTRKQGHIKITISQPASFEPRGKRTWSFDSASAPVFVG